MGSRTGSGRHPAQPPGAGSLAQPPPRGRGCRRSRAGMGAAGKLPFIVGLRRRFSAAIGRRHHRPALIVCPRQHRMAAPAFGGRRGQPARHAAGDADCRRVRRSLGRSRHRNRIRHGRRHRQRRPRRRVAQAWRHGGGMGHGHRPRISRSQQSAGAPHCRRRLRALRIPLGHAPAGRQLPAPQPPDCRPLLCRAGGGSRFGIRLADYRAAGGRHGARSVRRARLHRQPAQQGLPRAD